MKKYLVVGIILLAGFSLFYFRSTPSISPPEADPLLAEKIKIRGYTFSVELARTAEEKKRGLSYRDMLPKDYGMLFVFDRKDRYSFWMKDVRFSLDFIWIDGETIVDITPNVPIVPAGDSLLSYLPRISVDKILEVNAGTVEKLGITIGDPVEFLHQ